MPLLPIHILWINLVTDGLPGIALVSEPAEKNIMNLPPRPPKENLFAGGMVPKIFLSGIIMTAASLFVQWWAIQNGLNIKTQQTMVFTTLCFVQLGNALSSRSNFRMMLSPGLFANRGMWGAIIGTVILQLLIIYVSLLDTIFKTAVLGWESMSVILIVVLVSLICIEGLKYAIIRKKLK